MGIMVYPLLWVVGNQDSYHQPYCITLQNRVRPPQFESDPLLHRTGEVYQWSTMVFCGILWHIMIWYWSFNKFGDFS